MTNNNNQKKLENMVIGIIGYGNFGKVISQYLFPKNQQIIYSRRREQKFLFPTVKSATSIQELVEASDIIIPAVPIREFESVIKEVASSIKPNQIVMDVCSVKEYPINILKKYLLEKAQIIATHPMFGPVSIEKNNGNLHGLCLVMYNVGCKSERYDEIKDYFKNLFLNIVETNPTEHDKLAARSHFFSKIVKHIAFILHLQPSIIDTPSAAAIFDALDQTAEDKNIIEDMLTYNVYCKEVLTSIIDILENLEKGN